MDTNEAPTPQEAEAKFRELVAQGDMPQPNRVSYDAGRRELVFLWDTEEVAVVLALDEGDEEAADAPFT